MSFQAGFDSLPIVEFNLQIVLLLDRSNVFVALTDELVLNRFFSAADDIVELSLEKDEAEGSFAAHSFAALQVSKRLTLSHLIK